MKLYEGWKVGFAGAGVNFLAGVPYAWSIMATGLSQQLGWSPVQAAFPYTVFLLSYSFFMVLAGKWQDHAGPRLVVTTGGLLLGGASLLSALLLTPAGVTAMWGFFFGIGAACCFASVTPAAMKWFPMEKKGIITGVVVTGMGISAFVMAPLVYFLVGYGMRNAFLILGVILLVGVTPLARLIRNPPDQPVQTAALPKAAPWYGIFRFPQFYILWLMFWVTTGTGVTFVTHLDTMARVHAAFDRGYILVAFFAFFNAAGRIVAGLVSDRLGRSKAMTLDFSVTLLALVFLLRAASPLYLGVVISLLGLAYGGLYTLFPAAIATYFGDKNFGLVYGLVYTALGFAGAFPLVAGYLFGRQGDFQGTFLLLIVACSAVVILSLFLRQPVVHKRDLYKRDLKEEII
ncbi:MAG: MFS transporter [Bacillota bacterium]